MMARLGVTYHDVANAAEHVFGQGKTPTIELVRQILRTGSTTTIANHLRKWRAEQEETAGSSKRSTLPDEMLGLMQGLWERLQHQADSRVEEKEGRHQQECDLLKQELEKYKTNNQRWQKLLDQWTREKEDLMAQHTTLKAVVEELKEEKINLIAQVSAKDQHIQEKNERIDELHRLHAQTQANLEHYRESAHEQRLREQQDFENQKQQLKADIKAINHDLSSTKEKNSTLAQQYQQLKQSNASLETDHTKLNEMIVQQADKLHMTESAVNEYRQASQHWEGISKELQSKLDKMENKIIDSQVECKTLLQQLADTRLALDESTKTCKQLEIEKQEIEREKARVEGQLMKKPELAAT